MAEKITYVGLTDKELEVVEAYRDLVRLFPFAEEPARQMFYDMMADLADKGLLAEAEAVKRAVWKLPEDGAQQRTI